VCVGESYIIEFNDLGAMGVLPKAPHRDLRATGGQDYGHVNIIP